ncbi:hypothetical protein D9M68_234660 [compost metagenome]
MDMAIEKSASDEHITWIVSAYGLRLQFSDQESALTFADKLKERVDAPHFLPIPSALALSDPESRLESAG